MEDEKKIGKESVDKNEEKKEWWGEKGRVMERGIGWCEKRKDCGMRRNEEKWGGIDDERNFKRRRKRGKKKEDDGKRENGEKKEWKFMRKKEWIEEERINIGEMSDEEKDKKGNEVIEWKNKEKV